MSREIEMRFSRAEMLALAGEMENVADEHEKDAWLAGKKGKTYEAKRATERATAARALADRFSKVIFAHMETENDSTS